MAPSIDRMGMASGLDDRERDACLHRLGEHYAEGRLSADELDRRVQVALAAETPTDLEAAMVDVPLADGSGDPEDPGGGTPYAGAARASASPARRVTALVALAAGGLLLAATGPRSDLAEFAVGVTVALLGFAAHWWMGRGPAPATVIDLPVDEPGPVPTLPPRPLGRGNGMIPTQRTGD